MAGYINVSGLKFKLPVKPKKKDILFSDLITGKDNNINEIQKINEILSFFKL